MLVWRVRLMGAFELRAASGGAVRLSPLAAQALAWLAWRLGQPCSREGLIELLWPEIAPATGRNRLSVLLNGLRTQLEPAGVQRGAVLEADRAHVRLSAQAVATDVAEFHAACDTEDGDAAPERLERAVALYDAPLLDGVYADWAIAEGEVLADRFLTAARRLVGLHLSAGSPAEAMRVARLAVAREPLREEAHALVIRCALTQGDTAEARRQWAELERRLREELGIEPSEALRRRVFAAEPAARSVVLDGDRAAPAEPEPARRESPAGLTARLALTGVRDEERSWLERVAHDHDSTLRPTPAGSLLAEFPALGQSLRFLSAIGLSGRAFGLSVADVDPQRPGPARLAQQRALALAKAAHPGQVLAGEGAATLIRLEARELAGATLLGEYEVLPGEPPERVYQVDLADRPTRTLPPLAMRAAAAGAVPLVLTRFFGRERDLDDLAQRLTEHRLVTLTGPGGIGKTRLAIQHAQRRQETGETVWFVDLTAAREPQHVWERVLDVLGETASGTVATFERIVWLLRERPALLVLDNFEQLPAGADAELPKLLERVPGQRLLVTSRRRLEVAGQAELSLEPLPTAPRDADPDAVGACPSVALFTDRARAARPSFRLTERTAPAVAALCEALEGLPLALEIVAPRMHMMSPASLLGTLSDRLAWAAPRRADLPERQRTLGVTVAWNRDLLAPDLQAFLDGLAIFRSPFSAADAAAVLDDAAAAERLAQLHRFSLVVLLDGEEEPRCRLLETVRQFLDDLLTDEQRARLAERHARHFAALAAAARAEGPEMGGALALHGQLPDLRAALDWLHEHDPVAGLETAVALEPLWQWHGLGLEGRQRLLALLEAAPDAPLPLRARALLSAGACAHGVLPIREAVAFYDEALPTIRAAGDPTLLVEALWQLGLVCLGAESVRLPLLIEELLALAEQRGDILARLRGISLEGSRRLMLGAPNTAEPVLTALRIVEPMNDPPLLAIYLTQLGICHVVDGDLGAAERTLARVSGELVEFEGFWASRVHFAWVLLRFAQGRLGEAAEEIALLAPQITGSIAGYARLAGCLFKAVAMSGNLPAEAVTLHHAFHQLSGGHAYSSCYEERLGQTALERALAHLTPEQAARAQAAGEAMSLADVARLVAEVAEQLRVG